jgi:hypothetical protein
MQTAPPNQETADQELQQAGHATDSLPSFSAVPV